MKPPQLRNPSGKWKYTNRLVAALLIQAYKEGFSGSGGGLHLSLNATQRPHNEAVDVVSVDG